MNLNERALEKWPVKLRDCGDGNDENFLKRECWKVGYQDAIADVQAEYKKVSNAVEVHDKRHYRIDAYVLKAFRNFLFRGK